jgi:hypothetical protein
MCHNKYRLISIYNARCPSINNTILLCSTLFFLLQKYNFEYQQGQAEIDYNNAVVIGPRPDLLASRLKVRQRFKS